MAENKDDLSNWHTKWQPKPKNEKKGSFKENDFQRMYTYRSFVKLLTARAYFRTPKTETFTRRTSLWPQN
jgi:hypothetical protein